MYNHHYGSYFCIVAIGVCGKYISNILLFLICALACNRKLSRVQYMATPGLVLLVLLLLPVAQNYNELFRLVCAAGSFCKLVFAAFTLHCTQGIKGLPIINLSVATSASKKCGVRW